MSEQWLLLPEEIDELKLDIDPYVCPVKDLNKAQLRKVVEMGNEHCTEHHTRMQNVLKRVCPECWQALRKEAGLEE